MMGQAKDSRAVNLDQDHLFIKMPPGRLPVRGQIPRRKAGVMRAGPLIEQRYCHPTLRTITITNVRGRRIQVDKTGNPVRRIETDHVRSSAAGTSVLVSVRNSPYNRDLVPAQISADIGVDAVVEHVPVEGPVSVVDFLPQAILCAIT